MGQYWGWINPKTGEVVNTHRLASGCKWLEQYSRGNVLYIAQLILMSGPY